VTDEVQPGLYCVDANMLQVVALSLRSDFRLRLRLRLRLHFHFHLRLRLSLSPAAASAKAQLCRVHAHVPQALASRFKGPWSHDYETAYRRLQARGQLLRPDAAGCPQPVECATAW
jgi:hypothetical protein